MHLRVSARRIFVQGILLLMPLAITWLILRWLFRSVTGLSTPLLVGLLDRLSPELARSPLVPWLSPVASIALTVGLVMLVGLVGGNFVGRRLWNQLEQALLSVPLVRWFYGSTQQLMEAFRVSGSGAFREVVFLEYPRRGIWCLGFVTATGVGLLPEKPDVEAAYVFLPTTPIPTSGYTVLVPRDEVRSSSISVDEGLKLIVSGGFIAPRPRGVAAPGPLAGHDPAS